MHSPYEFMNQEFLIHNNIFSRSNRNDYMMLSSGTNEFPMPKLWKRLLKEEIDADSTYRLYVSPFGFDTANKSLLFYENFISSDGSFLNKNVIDNRVCMTIGGSQGISLVMGYLATKKEKKRVVLVGTTYSLYESLARHYGFEVVQLSSEEYYLPIYYDLINYIKDSSSSDIFVFTHPNNPSGEQYSQSEYNSIILELAKKNVFSIFDEECNMVITKRELALIESSVTKANYWENCIFVNSFSKTESVPGFRLGYLYGRKDIIEPIFSKQSLLLMSVQSAFVMPIFFTSLIRCLYLSNTIVDSKYEIKNIIHGFRLMFYKTYSIPSETIVNIFESYINNIDDLYKDYTEEMFAQEQSIVTNYNYALEKLSTFIISHSKLENGFNFVVKLKYTEKIRELDFVQSLLEQTGIALMTESAFELKKAVDRCFYIRISLAYPCDEFRVAIDKLYDYIDRMSKSK